MLELTGIVPPAPQGQTVPVAAAAAHTYGEFDVLVVAERSRAVHKCTNAGTFDCHLCVWQAMLNGSLNPQACCFSCRVSFAATHTVMLPLGCDSFRKYSDMQIRIGRCVTKVLPLHTVLIFIRVSYL